MAEIIVTREGQEIDRYLVNKDRITIGRSVTNDIVLEDLSASRSHAEILVEGGRFFLTDMGSANGSRVNGVSITDTEIFHDDVILIGESTLLFVADPSETESVFETESPSAERMVVPSESDVAFLTVRCARQRPQLHAITLPSVQIGRAPDNDIRVVDWFVEPYQAQVLHESEGFRLVNLSSDTRIFCNDEPVDDVLLQDGDVIQMGMSQIAFAIQDDAAREIETLKGAQPEEAPAGGATEYMAYVSDSEDSMEAPRAFDEAGAADLDRAIDQVVEGASGALSTSYEMNQEEQMPASAGRMAPVEPWDRWAEELAAAEETAPPPVGDASNAQDSMEESEPDVPEEEGVFAEMEAIVAVSSPEPEARVSDSEPEELAVQQESADGDGTIQEEKFDFLEAGFSELEPLAPVETVPDVEGLEEENDAGELEEVAPERAEETTPEEPEEVAPAMAEEPPAEDGLPGGVDLAKVAFWEKALRNPSPAVVKQAHEQLKRLTGRDYDV